MLTDEARKQFEALNTQGQAAKNEGDHARALEIFDKADNLAVAHGDNLKRMHALTPAARALWSMGIYDRAASKLNTASEIAEELGLRDEQGITVSNLGRLAAVKIVRTIPVPNQSEALKNEALPKFRQACELLRDHPHLYYRYANASHGSVAAVLAGELEFAEELVNEGFEVAFQTSTEPYDQKPTFQVNEHGLMQLAAAATVIQFSDKFPDFTEYIRTELIR